MAESKIRPDKTKIKERIKDIGEESVMKIYHIGVDNDLKNVCTHIVATSYQEAESLFRKHHPDVIIYAITVVACDVINLWAQ